MFLKELLALNESTKTAKPSIFDILKALKVGEKPDDAVAMKLDALMAKAEKAVLKMVLADPGDYNIDYGNEDSEVTKRDIRDETDVYTTHIGVHDTGLCFKIVVDTDSLGGSGNQQEDLYLDFAGKLVANDASVGDEVVMLDAQKDYARKK